MIAGEKRLVVVADDFGLTEGINRGVLDCCEAGTVTSASLIVNLPGSRQACAAALEGKLDIGIHLNLTAGHPMRPAKEVPSLVASDGAFHGLGGFIRKALVNRLAWPEVESEARAQIEQALSLGLAPTHLDSHHHIHILPTIFRIFSRLCQDFRIPFLRVPAEDLGVNPLHFRAALKKILISSALAMTNRSSAHCRIDRFYGISFYNAREPCRALDDILRRIKPGTSELMVHPGYNDPLLEEIDSYSRNREKEVEILTSGEIKRAFRSHEIKLLSFRDLLIE